MNDVELQALIALSIAESAKAQSENATALARGEEVHYGGPYGYYPATEQLFHVMQERKVI